MPFLSLGLLKDEREEVAREDVAAEGKGSGRDVSSSSQDGSLANHPATVSKEVDHRIAESRALPNHPLPSFDPAPSNGRAGEGRLRPYASSSDPNNQVDQGTSHLPPAIEELRQRVSGNELPEAFIWALLPTLSARSITGNPQVLYAG